MKKLLYMLLLPLLILSCTAERNGSITGQKTEVCGEIAMAEYPAMRVLVGKEAAVERLELWVFDEDGYFLERAVASVAGNAFTATITSSPVPRIIHFVANYTLLNPEAWVGRNQKEMVPSFAVEDTQETICMWAKRSYVSVALNENLGTVTLLRNMAKFGLTVGPSETSKLYDVSFALYNSWNKGTLAPFNPSAGDFTENVVTEPAGVAFAAAGAFKSAGEGNYFYGFERLNSVLSGASDQVTCLIVRARYNGSAAAYSYYKIDLVDANKVRYDVIRNHFYKMHIAQAKAPGKSSVEAALAGAAANNVALSGEMQTFPSFSDGTGLLTVDHTFLAFINNESQGQIKASYTPAGSSETSNGLIRVIRVEGDAVTSATHNGNGTIMLQLSPRPASGTLTSDVIIGIEGNPDLKRIVKVVVRNAYEYESFTANNVPIPGNVQVAATQGAALQIKAKLPEIFNAGLLPITFKVFTENFYPSAGGMLYGIEGGQSVYKYIVTSIPSNREIVLDFKSNKAASAGTISVKLHYFGDKVITVTNP